MIKYEVTKSAFLNKWMVVNKDTGLAQSFYDRYIDACNVARVLNKLPIMESAPKPDLKVVRHLRVVS